MDAYDHDGTGNLVLGLISGDGLVTDGTWSSRAKTPDYVTISQWPQRAVKQPLADTANKSIRACLARSLIAGRRLARTPCCLFSEGAMRRESRRFGRPRQGRGQAGSDLGGTGMPSTRRQRAAKGALNA
jgi:hypothetical protein